MSAMTMAKPCSTRTMKIDNFALTMHQSCPAKYDLRMRQGWASRNRSAALGFGSTLHHGLAEWYKTGNAEAALKIIEEKWDNSVPPHDYRNLGKALDVMVDYIKRYRVESFEVVGKAQGAPIIERTFTLPMGLYLPCRLSFLPGIDEAGNEQVDRFPERRACVADQHADAEMPVCHCGLEREPIEYGGIFDGLVLASGHVYILEHKSTSQLGSYYFDQFKPNNQVSGYIWAASLMSNMRVAGAIINAIGVYKASATKFERQVTARNDFEISEWRMNVYYECINIKQNELQGFWPMRTPSCSMYAGCEFMPVHTVNDPHHRRKRLEQDYIKEPWNYEERE